MTKLRKPVVCRFETDADCGWMPAWPAVFVLWFAVLGGDGVWAFESTPHSSAADIRWTSSKLVGTPDPPPPMRVQRVFSNLQFDSPTTMMDLPGRDRCLVLQKNGAILTFRPDGDPSTADVALDLGAHVKETADEKIAAARDATLDPDFDSNGFIYVVWGILPLEVEGGTRVSRFTFNHAEPPTIDPESRVDLLTYPSGDHVGASLNFGPDGMLYITTGDGSRPFPPDKLQVAQDLADVRGCVLRIDVHGDTLVERIPKDNPFVGVPGARGEIYAFGLRNGFRAAFDPATDDMWVADVGWERCEMIHRVVRGGNHGWSLYEGPYPVNPDQRLMPPQVQGPGPVIAPAIVMSRDQAQSVTGGCFVREGIWNHQDEGTPQPGEYLFGCFVNGNVWSADISDPDQPRVRLVASTGLRLIDFVDRTSTNEILLVDYGGGIYRLQANEGSQGEAEFPRRLSETGLFDDVVRLRPSPGVFGYDPVATMYRDGLSGQRWVGVPDGPPMNPLRKRYAAGTVFANTLSRAVVDDEGRTVIRRIETQLLVYDGLSWSPYTYAWNDSQTDATLVGAAGDRRELRVVDPILGEMTITHEFASRSQCMTCHVVANPGGVAFRPQNLWREEASSSPTDSFRSWSSMVAASIVVKAGVRPEKRCVDPRDESLDLESRARSYLEVNCAHCHRQGGGSATGMRLQRQVGIDEMAAIDEVAIQGDFGLGTGAKIIQPGHPETSVLMYRVATAGPGSMPRIGCRQIDLDGAALLWDWIASMEHEDDASVEATHSDLSQALLTWRRLVDEEPPIATAMARRILDGLSDPVLEGLFQPWLHPDDRTLVVGDDPDVDAILALRGDPESGRRWFHHSSAAQCRQCHRQGGQGGDIGPTLDSVAADRTPRQLLRQLTHPSEIIDPRWATVSVLTADGELISGLVQQDDEDALTLRQPDGRSIKVLTDDIEMRKTGSQSLMPVGTLSAMTPQEVADLLAFLMDSSEVQDATAKQPTNASANDESRGPIEDARIEFGRFRDCPVIENDHARVILCPQVGGRVMEYSLPTQDGRRRNAMFVSDYDMGQAPPTDAHGKLLPGWNRDVSAGRFDIGPELVTPKRPDLFKGHWTTERIDPLAVRMTSPHNTSVGVRLTREFRLDGQSSRLTCEQTITNLSDEPVTLCHWSRTLANGHGICLIPLDGFARFPNRYVRYEDGSLNLRPEDPHVQHRDGFIEITGPPAHPKLGFDTMSGWLAHQQRSGLLFIKQYPTFVDRPYLEAGGLTLSTWTPPGGETIEIEPIGPAETIAPGESASFTELWYLLDSEFPGDGQTLDLDALRSKVDQLPPTPW
ncbi:MAG: PQQ-dependent sugar dehydrogenase [Planctomycetota bacterium]